MKMSTKAARARQIVREEEVVISFQVLQEFYANAVHPRKLALTPAQAAAYCSAWLVFPVVPLGASTFVRTLEMAMRYQISNWDAAILAAALESGCVLVYSEDLNHGQDYGGVRVENPFREP
ncbi:MAG: PIN domain-containing protein [Gammaproteobacteria bacterium]